MAKFIHNVSGETLIVRGIELAHNDSFLIPDAILSSWQNDIAVNEKIISSQLQMSKDGVALITDAISGLSFLKGQIHEVDVKATPPFAQPDYRTKRDATDAWTVCPSNTTTDDDFLITEERYVSGGEMIYKNAKQGDYIIAEVHDKDGVIPLPYRDAVSEAWPIVARYIVKRWLKPTEIDQYGSFQIDTYPLNAKVTAGLYMRIKYVSSDIAGDREIAVNYHLTKKLV